ncbi:ATPase [Marinomonas ushuaiensis DSM 15871]|uniref:Sensory/regulatory protein RpfC n=1 Tax=Marinomonas ushuaiensis DSM 15871 TaxID=1122207 RepID=X7E4U8_9GAMM|nr:CHASE domain-containing protein [Marinomonas ushuaiensis]ETX11089.1 ATPase [Marinomonas ushuaiensis DSM 15871]
MNKVQSKNIYTRWVILTLFLGVLVTCLFSYQIKLNNEERIVQVVNQASQKIFKEVVARVQTYQYGLRGARGVVLTAGESDVSREVFRQYSLTRDLEVEFPGARGFGFIRRVPIDQVEPLLQTIRQSGWPDFQIKELSSNFSERYLIQFIEPFETNAQAIGLDIASEKNRREAARAALRTGEVQITGPITLVQASGQAQQSVLILMPIYRGGKTPSSLLEREKAGFGWSYAALLMEDMLSELDLDAAKVHYELFDITNLDDKVRFYDSGDLNDRHYEHIQSTFLYGRHWESRFSITAAFIEDLQLSNPFIVLLTGILITFLGTVLVAMVRVNMARKQEVITYQSRITAVVESSADGIISKNLEGIIVSWNKGAEHIFGYTREEAIGKTASDLLVPADLIEEYQSALASVRDKKESLLIETRRKTKSGFDVPVALTLSPIFDNIHTVIGISKSVRDISERKKSEAKIRDLNTNLESQVKTRTLELQELNLLLNDVLEASSEISIIATDTNGVIKLFNSGAERMLGYSAEEVIGQLTPAAFHVVEEINSRRELILEETGSYIARDMDVLIGTVSSDDYESKEWTYRDKFGKTRPVSLVVTPMKSNDGEVVGFLGMAMDITDQKNNQKALESVRDQLLIATKAAKLGVWCWYLDTDVLEWNDIMFDIYQYPLSLNGQGMSFDHWRDRLHLEDRDEVIELLGKSVSSLESYRDVFRIVLPDESIRYIKADAYIEQNEYGKAVRVIGVNQDITSERELEAWLREAKDQADAASASKSSFLANMSHEIRTPMNAMLGMLYLAKRTELTYQQDDYISKAQISAKSLLGLINDILDFSKVDAGKLELERVPFEVESLLYELSTVLSGSSLNNDVELIFDIDKDIPAYLVGDKLRLLQILINLVSNAVKFTLEGSVVLEIKSLPSPSSDISRLSVSVTDTGIGISKDQLESIFEVFSQAESSTARRFGGSGLGLVICRRFVALMGGELSIESTLDEGSRFFFTVDLPIATTPIIEKSPERLLRKPIRVLIVESNSASQIILGRMAQNLGWFYQKAEGFQEVVNIVNEENKQGCSFDVILLDIKTTGFNGRDSLERMEADFDSSVAAPKIILLANASNEKINDALDFISNYLLKPLTLSRLSETVYKALSNDQNLLDKNKGTWKDKASLTGIKLLLVEDNAFNQQVATELLVSEGAIVTVASGGLEGVTAVIDSERNTFDLVLMDMQMPDVDGLEATRLIRKDTRFDLLPIVAMTANVAEGDRQLCFQAGMNDHIGKPLDIDQIISCILKYVNPIAVSSDNKDLDGNSETETIMQNLDVAKFENHEDIQSILNRFGGSVELFKSVVDGFLAESKELLNTIEQAVNSRDKIKTRESVHTLKGASLTMGLLCLSNRLDSIEQLLKNSKDSQEVELCFSKISVIELDTILHNELTKIFTELDKLN